MITRLTQKMETFCVKYFEIGNATEAVIEAGYACSRKSAEKIGSQNLAKPAIKARIAKLRQKVEDKSVASVLERKRVLSDIVRTIPIDILEISQDRKDAQIKPEALKSPAVSYIRTEQRMIGVVPVRVTRVGLTDKVRAITELNKMEHIYSDGSQFNIDNRKVIFIIGKGYADDKPAIQSDKQDTE